MSFTSMTTERKRRNSLTGLLRRQDRRVYGRLPTVAADKVSNKSRKDLSIIDIKRAFRNVKEYAMDILEVSPQGMLLEEVRPFKEEWWDITLSFEGRTPKSGETSDSDVTAASIGHVLFGHSHKTREMKTFRVKKETGEIEAMFNVPSESV